MSQSPRPSPTALELMRKPRRSSTLTAKVMPSLQALPSNARTSSHVVPTRLALRVSSPVALSLPSATPVSLNVQAYSVRASPSGSVKDFDRFRLTESPTFRRWYEMGLAMTGARFAGAGAAVAGLGVGLAGAGVGTGVNVGAGVGGGVAVGVGVGVSVAVGSGIGVGVAVGSGIGVSVAAGIGVGVGRPTTRMSKFLSNAPLA